MHDDLVRIPCAMHLPPSVPRETRERLTAAAATTIGALDLLPTLLGLVGGTVPSSAAVGGRDLGAAAEPERRVLRMEDRRYLYLRSRLRLNTNSQGKNMTRVTKARNRIWRATVARRHVVQGFVDGPHKLIVTEFVAPASIMARAGSWWLARQHNGDPFVVVRGSSWYGLELFDVDADPGETVNLLLRRDDARLGDRVMSVVDAYRAGDFSPKLAPLASR